MNPKNATCEFGFLAGERLMDPDTIVNAGLFEDGQFDYRNNATVAPVEGITDDGYFHIHLTGENLSRLGDALLKIARILTATGYELSYLNGYYAEGAADGTAEEEYWSLVNGHIVASTRQGAIGSILRDDDGGWRDTTGTAFGSDNIKFAAFDVLNSIFEEKYRADILLESIFIIACADEDHPGVITREELNDALSNILRAGFDAVDAADNIDTVDDIDTAVAGVHLDN